MIMKKLYFFIALFCVLSASLIAQDYQSLTFFDQDTIQLELDLFVPNNAKNDKIPLVIFVHGGGFSGGKREAGHPLARHLVECNIACATITYTLYMKDKSFSCDGILSEKIKAIQIAANQLWSATTFLISQKDKYKFDASKIFIAGSSAGAETVLHAAYWDREQMNLFDHDLEDDFSYAGIIAGAGAIMDLNLITLKNIIPTMMFHGDADPTVPYATAAHHYCPPNSSGWLMLFGSHSIARHIKGLGGTTRLTTFKGGDHSFAGAYFSRDQEHVSEFIMDVLDGGKFGEFVDVIPGKKD